MKNILLAVIIISCMLSSFSCSYAVRYDGPYEGRIIDAKTGKPVEGVVVLGVWYKEKITVGGAVHHFYDAQETVTDKDGEFSIQGLGLKIFSNVVPMSLLVFKSGYEYLGLFPWDTLEKDILLRKEIKWEGKKAVIPLKKLSLYERKKQGTPLFPSDAYRRKKIPLLLKEINKEEIQFGRQPYPED